MIPEIVLLQPYWKKDDPKELTYALIVIGVLLVALTIFQAIKQGAKAGGQTGYSKGRFRRQARAAGLAEEEIRFLDEYSHLVATVDPAFLFSNRPKLSAFLKDVFRAIEKNSTSEADAEERKALLFAIGERLNQAEQAGRPIRSTRQLGKNTPLSFITPKEESYPTIIVRSEAEGLAVEPVRDPYGDPIPFKRGTKLTCYFYAPGHQGYQFVTRVQGWDRTGGRELLLLAHSDAVGSLPQRRHQRRELEAPCRFYRVAVSARKEKGAAKASARVEGLAYPGTIVDISAGGAGIQSANALPAGDFLKLEFDTGTGLQSVFGKVIRLNRLKGSGGMMHVQFVKISQKSLNAILSYVNGYTD